MQKLYRAALAAIVVCSFVACNAHTVDTPTTSSVPEPVASASTPTPTATPVTPPAPGAGEGQEANDGYLIEFENNAGFKVTNKTDIGQAYRAYTTNFDNQEVETAFKVSGTVPPEESWGDSFNATCVQLDITQFGYAGLPLKGGAAFFDKNGKQFNPSRSPEKVTECRTTPCEEKWLEIENDPDISYGDYGACSPETEPSEANGEGCSKKRTVTITYTEQNTCTKATRKGRVVVREESASCECQCEEYKEPKETYGDPVWAPEVLTGQCRAEVGPYVDTYTTPTLNCRQIGTQPFTVDYKCEEDAKKTRNLCRNVACPVDCVGEWKFYKDQEDKKCGPDSFKWEEWKFDITTPASNGGLACKYKDGEKEIRNKTPFPCPTQCYYTISGEPQGADRKALCAEAAGGTYVQWIEQDKHCNTDLPGLYKDASGGKINWNLVPGQSSDECRKGDAPKH